MRRTALPSVLRHEDLRRAQLHPRAMIQFDDYGYWKGCGKGLHEYKRERGLTFATNPIDGTGVWFSKAEAAARASVSADG